MKVRNSQIEVMWLFGFPFCRIFAKLCSFFAVSLCDVAIGKKTGFTDRTIRLKGLQKEIYGPIQIRPPP
jgi:hypothetical protein